MSSQGGRPPGPTVETKEQVLRAAFALLGNEGPAALTPVRIHRETGVARTTVYRHWPTPASIVEAVLAVATARRELDDLTGELEPDLLIAVETITFRLANRPVRRFYDACRLHGDPDESPTMSERYMAGLIAPVTDVVAAAVDRGELRSDDVAALTAEICGPLILRSVLLGEDLPADIGQDMVRAFLAKNQPSQAPVGPAGSG